MFPVITFLISGKGIPKAILAAMNANGYLPQRKGREQ